MQIYNSSLFRQIFWGGTFRRMKSPSKCKIGPSCTLQQRLLDFAVTQGCFTQRTHILALNGDKNSDFDAISLFFRKTATNTADLNPPVC